MRGTQRACTGGGGRRWWGTLGAICAAGDQRLATNQTPTVPGPPSLSVADATVDEGPYVTADFIVTLDGEVASAMLGAAFRRERTMIGLALSHTRGAGSYRGRARGRSRARSPGSSPTGATR